jgi:hypothetical protein
MAYDKQTWADGEAGGTPITAARLLHIEQGIADVESEIPTSTVPATRKVNGHALSADVTVTKGDVGLGSVDNTADSAKSVAAAAKLTTARKINGVDFDGTANIDAPTVDASKLTTGVVSIERMPAGTPNMVESVDGAFPDRPTARTDIKMIFVTYDGTAQPNQVTSPAVNGAYEGDFYWNVAT